MMYVAVFVFPTDLWLLGFLCCASNMMINHRCAFSSIRVSGWKLIDKQLRESTSKISVWWILIQIKFYEYIRWRWSQRRGLVVLMATTGPGLLGKGRM